MLTRCPGLDTNLIIIPLREFGKEYSRTLPNLAQLPPLQSVPNKRLLVSWWDREVNIWRVNGQSGGVDEQDGFVDPGDRARTLVAKIIIQVRLLSVFGVNSLTGF